MCGVLQLCTSGSWAPGNFGGGTPADPGAPFVFFLNSEQPVKVVQSTNNIMQEITRMGKPRRASQKANTTAVTASGVANRGSRLPPAPI